MDKKYKKIAQFITRYFFKKEHFNLFHKQNKETW